MNIPIYFNYTAKDIKNISNKIIDVHTSWLKNMSIQKHSPNDFLNSYLSCLADFDYIYNVIIFLKYISPDEKVRNALFETDLLLKKYFMNFYKSEDNYKLFLILKKIKINKNNDTDNLSKLIKNILKSFEDNGVKLKKNDKLKFIKIDSKLIILESKFSKNIADGIKKIKYSKDELQNIDDNVLSMHKKKDGYIFDTTYPDESVILRNCSVSNSRKKMYHTFNNVATQNLSILKDIVNLRYQKSILFGFKNTVSHYLDYNRIATLNKINKLLDKLVPILKKKAIKEYNNLLEVSSQSSLNDYDMAYYSNIYKKKYLDLDEKVIKKYFPSYYTIPKILQIYADIFCIKIKLIKVDSYKYWHKDVELYEVSDKNILGYFYLDLYPRDGKYTHAATFDIQTTYKNMSNNRVLPVTAIVCNFSLPEKGKDYSLFTFGEITTFCHELGHALHNVLSNVKYRELAGISMEEDFGEMPSQFFENWCYNKDFLTLISCHFETKKKMPIDIINKIIQNKNYNNGIHYLTQILYIKYDLTIHQQKNVTDKYLQETWFKILSSLLPFKFDKTTHPMCRFDHIIEYASGYYGYLWSIIYAYDAFSLFEEKGVFNKKLGMRFRQCILEKGGTEKGVNMLEKFLRRKTNNKSFYKIF